LRALIFQSLATNVHLRENCKQFKTTKATIIIIAKVASEERWETTLSRRWLQRCVHYCQMKRPICLLSNRSQNDTEF